MMNGKFGCKVCHARHVKYSTCLAQQALQPQFSFQISIYHLVSVLYDPNVEFLRCVETEISTKATLVSTKNQNRGRNFFVLQNITEGMLTPGLVALSNAPFLFHHLHQIKLEFLSSSQYLSKNKIDIYHSLTSLLTRYLHPPFVTTLIALPFQSFS